MACHFCDKDYHQGDYINEYLKIHFKMSKTENLADGVGIRYKKPSKRRVE